MGLRPYYLLNKLLHIESKEIFILCVIQKQLQNPQT
jgi:hypothetical protein